MSKLSIALLLAAACCFSAPAAADAMTPAERHAALAHAVDLYQRGDLTGAQMHFTALVAAGEPAAAHNLAVMHLRGGQVTFHGPGQVVAYPLINLKRLGIYIKEYVFRLEAAVIQTLDAWGVVGFRVAGAPGIYVNLADPLNTGLPTGPRQDPFDGLGKIAALGVKVSNHCTYHGVALNVAMNLEPFERINPCGYAGLRTVDLVTLGIRANPEVVAGQLAERLSVHLSR